MQCNTLPGLKKQNKTKKNTRKLNLQLPTWVWPLSWMLLSPMPPSLLFLSPSWCPETSAGATCAEQSTCEEKKTKKQQQQFSSTVLLPWKVSSQARCWQKRQAANLRKCVNRHILIKLTRILICKCTHQRNLKRGRVYSDFNGDADLMVIFSCM